MDDETYEQLAEEFGLSLLLLQNDIEEYEVIRILHLNGFIDLDDYYFSEIPEECLEDED